MPKAKSGRAKRKAAAAAVMRRTTGPSPAAIATASTMNEDEKKHAGLVSLRDVFGVRTVRCISSLPCLHAPFPTEWRMGPNDGRSPPIPPPLAVIMPCRLHGLCHSGL